MKYDMANILDYLDWRGDLTLEQAPFNEVDNLILSQLVYVNFDYIVPTVWSDQHISMRDAMHKYFELYSDDQIQQFSYTVRISIPLLRKLGNCLRFANAKLSKFEHIIDLDQTKQFSAMHIELDDGSIYISYRGTDNTIVGWKENFNMSVHFPVPAQFEAVRYLERTTEELNQPIRLGGHSKGGNLAVYAAVMCCPSVKKQIVGVYNNDGPGFDEKMIKSNAYQQILHLIQTIVPQSSIVGMLLEHQEQYTVVKSYLSPLMQHEAFSWEVLGDSFVKENQLEKKSELIDVTLKSWLAQMDRVQREQFITAVFYAFEVGEIRTFEDFTRAKWKKVNEMIRVLNQSQENKEVLIKTLKLLFHEGRKVFLTSSEKKFSK